MNLINLEIITPEKIIFEKQVESLIIPSYGGKLGILPGHTEMVVQIIPGELSFTIQGNKDYFALGGGYGEITQKRVRLFVEEANLVDEIDIERVNQQTQQAKAKIKSIANQDDLIKAEAALKVAISKLKIAKHRKQKR
ncbi:MAG: ATP synthase F1 subunit epsilon [bacterium]